MMQNMQTKFQNLANWEKTIIIVSSVVMFLSFICFFIVLAVYNLTVLNQNTMRKNQIAYQNGNLYTYSDCYTCQPSGCGIAGTTPCLTFSKKVQIQDVDTQKTFYNTPINLNNLIFFPGSNQQNSDSDIGTQAWFSRQTKILPSQPLPYVFLDDYLLTNNLNTLAVGYFDYNPTTNQTTVCDTFNAEGSVYYAIDTSNSNNKYICICVNNPPNPAIITPKEYCLLS